MMAKKVDMKKQFYTLFPVLYFLPIFSIVFVYQLTGVFNYFLQPREDFTLELILKLVPLLGTIVLSLKIAIHHLSIDRMKYISDRKGELILQNSKISLEENISNILRKSLFFRVCHQSGIIGIVGNGNLNVVNEQRWQQKKIAEDLIQYTFPALSSIQEDSYHNDTQAQAVSERRYIYKIKGLLSEIKSVDQHNISATLLLATQIVHCTPLSRELLKVYLTHQCHRIEYGVNRRQFMMATVTWAEFYTSTHHAQQLYWYLEKYKGMYYLSEGREFQNIVGILAQIGKLYPILVNKHPFPSYFKLRSFENLSNQLKKRCQNI